MIKILCDKCGTELNSNVNQINIDINSYGNVVKKLPSRVKREYQLCTQCMIKVADFMTSEVAESFDEVIK